MAALIGQGRGVLELPGRDFALVELVQFPISTTVGLETLSDTNTNNRREAARKARATYLRIIEPEKNGRRDQKAGPHINRLDTQVSRIRADHVGDTPLENNANDV